MSSVLFFCFLLAASVGGSTGGGSTVGESSIGGSIVGRTDICDAFVMEDIAAKFFYACESGKGWNGTKAFVISEQAAFSAQVTDSLPGPKLSKVTTVRGYAEWMVGVIKEFGPKATVELKARAIDGARHTALFFAVFAGLSEYVYSLKFDPEECKITDMVKIWNDGFASQHPPA